MCAAAMLVAILAACGQESSSPSTDGGSTGGSPSAARGSAHTGPPPLALQRPEGEVDLPAYSGCSHSDSGVGGGAVGAPQTDPPPTAATDPLTFTFGLEGWEFTASFRQPGPRAECERAIQADVVARGDGTFIVPAPGPAGRWEVQISGNADGGGSLATTFGWTTSADSTTTPPARGDVGLLGPPSVSDDDGVREAYGPSLTLTGLAVDPIDVTAELVLSDAGARATYPLYASRDDACPWDGMVVLAGEHPDKALDLPDLGEPPYAYEVLLTLDGHEYVGTGQWPDDLTPAMSNQLRLTWSPPLPAWKGSP